MVPLKDAATIAYVSAIHAQSELNDLVRKTNDICWTESWSEVEEDIKDALSDLNTIVTFLKEHVVP